MTTNTVVAVRGHLRLFYRRVIGTLRTLLQRPVMPIDETLWHQATAPFVFVARLSHEENRRLRLIAADFLSRKNIIGAAGLVVTELIRIQIAAQACILILELGVDSYDGWSDIVVYPAAFQPRRTFTDAAGVVHHTTAVLSGEAWQGGPVVLSHAAIRQTNNGGEHRGAHNVVIHEFAHKLDMRNGNANGFPPLHRGMHKLAWQQAFMAAYLDFCERTDHASALAHTDGGAAWQALPLDAYAAENPAEFFAVISEAFFVTPADVKTAYPAAYAQLVAFYRQNPLASANGNPIIKIAAAK